MWKKGFIIIVIFQLIEIGQVRCDFYTSIASLENLLLTEKYLVENYENYLIQVKITNEKIISYLDKVKATIEEIKKDPVSYFENPLNAFKALKRCAIEWKILEGLILSDRDAEGYERNVKKMDKLGYAIPTIEDLIGASKAVARLQSVYALDTSDLTDGLIYDFQYNATFTADDCFNLGTSLSDAKEYKYSTQWLLESRALLKHEFKSQGLAETKNFTSYNFPFLSDINILEYLAANMFESGNKKMAKIFNEELLKNDPNNEYGLANKELFEAKIIEERQSALLGELEPKEEKKTPTADQLYKDVCSGELYQTPKKARKLRCRYTARDVPFCRLAPFKMEELSHDPFIAFFYNAVYDKEMKTIMDLAKDVIKSIRSKGKDDNPNERTSKYAMLDYTKNGSLKHMHRRLQDITGLHLDDATSLQVVNYGIGGHHLPHYDFSKNPEKDFRGQGNRLLTALFYINDVELAGATAFPDLKIVVPPFKGGMLIWYNLNKTLHLDPRTRHAGCPVIKGSKWVVNQWFHERGQEFTHPCSKQ